MTDYYGCHAPLDGFKVGIYFKEDAKETIMSASTTTATQVRTGTVRFRCLCVKAFQRLETLVVISRHIFFTENVIP